MNNRTYYSVRTGINPNKQLNLPSLLEVFFSIYDDFTQKDYFQEAFGYFCVDAGDVPGKMGTSIETFFIRKLRKSNLWPIREHYKNYSEDDLFDIIELLYDYISKPIDGYYYSFNGCGWHYNQFDKQAGQEEYRNEVNIIIRDYGEGYEISTQGEIVVLGPSGINTLLEANLPQYDEVNVDSRVKSAIRQFRHSRSSIAERRDAIRNLGDVLEFLRPKLKEVLTADESDLFNILNNFSIRHHNTKQKADYEQAVFLSWLFYYYLAAYHAAIRLIQEREKQNPSGS